MTAIEHAQTTYDAIREVLGTRQRMLVVDDSKEDVMLIQRRLREMPVDVDVAYSVQEAITLIEHQEYFLVMIDLAMPVQGGSALVEWMTKRPGLMRRVICTGSTKSDELEKSLTFGPLALMSKTFTPEHFLQLLYLVNLPHPRPDYAPVERAA